MPPHCFYPAKLMHLHPLQPLQCVHGLFLLAVLHRCRHIGLKTAAPVLQLAGRPTGYMARSTASILSYSNCQTTSRRMKTFHGIIVPHKGARRKRHPVLTKLSFFFPVGLSTDTVGYVCSMLPYNVNIVRLSDM
jgi:hypothetical protein